MAIHGHDKSDEGCDMSYDGGNHGNGSPPRYSGSLALNYFCICGNGVGHYGVCVFHLGGH